MLFGVDKKTNLWPAVALVAIVVTGVVVLSVTGKDSAGLLALVPVLLGLAGYQTYQAQQIRHQTNGNTSDLLAQLDKLTTLLALAEPVRADDVPTDPRPAGRVDLSGPDE